MAVITKPIHITDDTIDKVLATNDKPVIIDFWAEWCGPCHMIAPILEEIASDFEGKALVTKLNVMKIEPARKNLESGAFQLCCFLKMANWLINKLVLFQSKY